jgi:selenocysteine lyase/cysteine desulfurase
MYREYTMASTRPPPDADLSRWRSDTPGCADRIHLNNAGAALVPRPVSAAVAEHLALESTLGGYEAAETMAGRVQEAYAAVGQVVGCGSHNIAVVANSTVAFSQALSAFDFKPGDQILTTRNDYASNQIMFLSLARRLGVEVVRAEDLPEGGVDPDSIRDLMRRRRPALVAVTWVPTNSGLVQPVEAVGEVCHAADVPYLVDGCQAVGQIAVDVARIRCDYLAATARKFLRGPRGIGFLYASDRVLRAGAYPLLVDMRGADWTAPDEFELAPDARRFESWESPSALLLGLGAAARYALEVGIATACDRARRLAALARDRLARLPGVRVLDRAPELCAIVTAALGPADPEPIKLELRRRGINVSTTTRTSAVIDMDEKGAAAALRFSPHYYNTEEEVVRAVETLEEVLADGQEQRKQ